ncbi:substrate-binding domain-containing protein [Algisphaera agarilytica]|uniref:DNA-binding LacI/PurR family transcriptional regulator n=1 Tax=Algisphaera agarilytica TaxID=1385975 RepID=A0A7X0LJV8_9BACT|nr:substrate-binding domain-containing protein [Algisphaera agarilytica]MBB6429179.1 DNA-binding LacI/PurR family transcriptional regulator [Algisphaera agarilytica]
MNEDRAASQRPVDPEQAIRKTVRSVPVGGRLPSIREFRDRFSLGQATVVRILTKLRDEGLIVVKPKSGSYRSEPHELPIYVVYRHKTKDLRGRGFYGEFISQLILGLSEHGHAVRLHAVADRDEFVDLLGNIGSTNSRILTFGIKSSDLEYTQNRDRVNYTVVHVLPDMIGQIPASVNIDDREIIRLQLQHLVEQGHTRIAYLHRYDEARWVRAEHMRWVAFHEEAVRLGVSLRPEWMRYVGHSSELIAGAVDEVLATDDRPTAIVLSGDRQGKHVYDAIKNNGLEVGKDLALVSVNGMVWCEYMDPPLSSVRVSAYEGVDLVIKILEQLEAGDDPTSETIRPELLVRASSDFSPKA